MEHWGGTDYFSFDGDIDEVKILNNNFSDTEVWAKYQQQKPLFFNDVKTDGSDIRFFNSNRSCFQIIFHKLEFFSEILFNYLY